MKRWNSIKPLLQNRTGTMLITTGTTSSTSISLLLLTASTAQGSVVNGLFPQDDEYDFGIMDPASLHGAPLGGFARASTSRLARLPLPLPVLSDIALEDFVPHHATVSDAKGRPFVCRVYHQDELEESSWDDGMFELALLKADVSDQNDHNKDDNDDDDDDDNDNDRISFSKGTDQPKNDDDPQQLLRQQRSETVNAPHQMPPDPRTLSESVMDDGEEFESAAQDTTEAQEDANIFSQFKEAQQTDSTVDPAQQQQQQATTKQGPKAASSIVSNDKKEGTKVSTTQHFIDTLAVVIRRLVELDGVCAQLHMGWWSYEWCHEMKVSQFHIHVLEGATSARELEIQDVSNLGNFDRRSIEITYFDDDESSPLQESKRNHATVTLQSGKMVSVETVLTKIRGDAQLEYVKKRLAFDPTLQEIARVTDVYLHGDICEATNEPRRTEVTIQCCSDNSMKRFQSGVLVHNKPVASSIAGIPAAVETDDCVYNVTVCTPLLCKKNEEALEFESVREARDNNHRIKHGSIGSSMPSKSPQVNAAEMSIEAILEFTFGKSQTGCMQTGSGGWWLYELCHKKHIRQFHETTVMDRLTGGTSTEIEDEYFLGYYVPTEDDKADEEQEEPPHDHDMVINATKLELELNTRRRTTDKSKKSHLAGNGAYYPVEFQHGDVCEHPDVTDSAVKAGSVGKGGIERGSSIRYSCGPTLDMSVKEDSTCHYMVDVSIPLLCEHPLFKASVPKRQIVKCLAV